MVMRNFYPAEAVGGSLENYKNPGGINFGPDLKQGLLYQVMQKYLLMIYNV